MPNLTMPVPLTQSFDAVVMLTWSDWHTEPRSNRYHYASRFAKQVPVYFVQPDGTGDAVIFEPIAGTSITLVHVADDYGQAQAERLSKALHTKGIQRPLVWVYNAFFDYFLSRYAPPLAIFHATEDYVSPSEGLRATPSDLSAHVRATLKSIDMIVAVSEGVAVSYRTFGGFDQTILVLPNGCDFTFWNDSGAARYQPPPKGEKVALFQGGINQRLDFALLSKLSETMPEWQFWFCGKSLDGGDEWQALKQKPNVWDFGLLAPGGIADLSRQSLVGLIPFKQDVLMRRSLPLKAYEYLACGLPVVSIPIDSLAARPEFFQIETTAQGFAKAIEAVALSRRDPTAVAARMSAAKAMSYDDRFAELEAAISQILEGKRKIRRSLNVLMLYDDRSTHVGTIREHLEAFQAYSRHNFHFMPATGILPGFDTESRLLDLNMFDAVLIHYAVRISLQNYLSPAVANAVAGYRGPKLLFIQDEYDTTETARQWIEKLGLNAIYTNVPLDEIGKIYPSVRFPNVDFIPTLTGYVPEDPKIDSFVTPIAERKLLIGYRGRQLPHQYGALGQEKLRIGVEMRKIADRHGFPVDIEVDDSRRIYGLDWYAFMGSARATLGTESGANVFDFDGKLAELATQHKDMSFEAFSKRFLKDHEGLVRMNQVSPKIFEAIRLRTALVLFEGGYSGVVQANKHYIPLKRDFSNAEEVFSKLQDVNFLEELTSRAYKDVIESNLYSYETFVKGVDVYIDEKALGRRRARIVSVPFMAIYGSSDARPLWSGHPSDALLNNLVLSDAPAREAFVELVTDQNAARHLTWGSERDEIAHRTVKTAVGTVAQAAEHLGRVIAPRVARRTWNLLPMSTRKRGVALLREVIVPAEPARRSLLVDVVRSAWQWLPARVRARIAAKL